MYSTDRDGFEALLAKLSTTFSKPITDEIRAAYWEALKDLPISTVQRMAEQHARFSKFFPKPFELRPREERPKDKDAAEERRFRDLVVASGQRLDELWATDHETWLRSVAPKVYELGRAKGMPDTFIAQKLRDYVPVHRA